MLAKKREEIQDNKEKYEKGVLKLQETGEQVAELEEGLKITTVMVEEKKKNASEQAAIVGGEKTKVDAEAKIANEESAKCKIIADEVEVMLKDVNEDLAAAIPALKNAEAALNGLNVKQFSVLKALNNAPKPVQMTFSCVMNLFAGVDPLVPVDKKGRLNAPGGDPWKCKDAQFKNPQDFLNKLKEYKGEIEAGKVPKQNFDAIKSTLENEDFTKEKIINASECCGNLCDWVKNIDTFYHIFMNVEPKKLAAEQAEKDLEAANTKKAAMI
jgi:dynein heavy chain